MTIALRRRDFIAAVGGVAAVGAAWPFAARAQQTDRKRRIGALIGLPANDSLGESEVAAFEQALQRLGWIAGRNIEIAYRWAGADSALIQAFAKELVADHPDVLMARSTPAVGALKRETSTIPIVFTAVSEPVASGLITSLARPGGNITGFAGLEPSVAGKWLDLLKEIAPSVARVGLLFNPVTAPFARLFLQSAEAAAVSLGMEALGFPVQSDAEIRDAVAALAEKPDSGLVGINDTFIVEHRKTIIEAANRHRLPAVFQFLMFPADGGLMSYGFDSVDLFPRAAAYVDRILRGEKPGDLPVQQPTKFVLVVNLKTAKALGLAVPPTLIARADEVIE
jgi:putative ABC transport system substrate-binding protein